MPLVNVLGTVASAGLIVLRALRAQRNYGLLTLDVKIFISWLSSEYNRLGFVVGFGATELVCSFPSVFLGGFFRFELSSFDWTTFHAFGLHPAARLFPLPF